MEIVLQFPALKCCNIYTNDTYELGPYRSTLTLPSLYFIYIFSRQMQFTKLLNP